MGLEDRQYTSASRIIRDTVEVGLIRSADPTSASRKDATYFPYLS